MPTTITSALTELGLGENEAVLYEILIKYPNATIPLLTKETKLSRTMLYYVLKRLTEFALITTGKKDNKTVYEAVSPDRLEEIVREQEKELVRQKSALGTIMSDLRSTYNLSHDKPGVKFFEGPEGIKQVTFDSLEAKNEILTYLDVDATQKYIAEMNKKYVKKRVELNIKKRMIVADTPATRERYKNYSPLLEVRLMPKNIKPFKTIVQIYNDKVSFSTLNEKKMIGVIIKDEQIAELHRSVFEFVWQTLPNIQLTENKKTTPPPSSPPPVLPAVTS